MPKQLYDPGKGKMRIVGMVSGSGKGVIAIIDRQKELRSVSADNFEVVGIFTDNPHSRASSIAKDFGLPLLVNDIRQFYQERGRPINDLKVREAYDRETVRLLEPLEPDILVFAGYVWVATHVLWTHFKSLMHTRPIWLSCRVANGLMRELTGSGLRYLPAKGSCILRCTW
jgi:folate-dependent phosphoribosylglycinamide formyltransferase PurN